nr:MAG TPA: hypothetical protein [Caudoviricetes sp.]
MPFCSFTARTAICFNRSSKSLLNLTKAIFTSSQ